MKAPLKFFAGVFLLQRLLLHTNVLIFRVRIGRKVFFDIFFWTFFFTTFRSGSAGTLSEFFFRKSKVFSIGKLNSLKKTVIRYRTYCSARNLYNC